MSITAYQQGGSMQMRLKSLPRYCRAALFAGIIGIAGTTAFVHAQPFEYAYGGSCEERGNKSVVANSCTQLGMVSVGTTTTTGNPTGCGNSDVYVVRTLANGTAIWERSYDIGTRGGDDSAYSIRNVPDGGFIAVGTTSLNGGQTDIFLLRLDCDGNVLWSKIYGNAVLNDEGRDVVVTNFGDRRYGTSVGDFVVAGWTYGGLSGTQDGYLMRVNSSGGLIWEKAYNGSPSGGDEYFLCLKEALYFGVGDEIIAGGATNSYQYGHWTGFQGLGVRVDGNTGLITPGGSHGVGIYDGPGNEEFRAVTELTGTIGGIGDLVFAGVTDAKLGTVPKDIYLVRTGPNPCAMVAQSLTGDVQGTSDDIANSVAEVIYGGPFSSTGNLVVAGLTHNGFGGSEAFLLPVSTTTMLAGTGATYGDQSSLDEAGNSVLELVSPLGYSEYAITGSTKGLVSPDPEDMYLVRTDLNGHTPCYHSYEPQSIPMIFPWHCEEINISTPSIRVEELTSTPVTREWGTALCLLPKRTADPVSAPAETGNSSLTIYPNPVKSGSPAMVDFTPVNSESISVSVNNALGETITSFDRPSDGKPTQIPIETRGWSAGTYMVKVKNGAMISSIKIVVVE